MSADAVKDRDARRTEQTLRRLFLTLFLRGRTSRGLKKESAPETVWRKLSLVLLIYAVIGGLMSMVLMGQPVMAIGTYLHSMTLVFLGMFIASAAGEVLFNKEEADILLHRPVTARALLWAKIAVLVQVSLWLAVAFNLAGFFVGAFTKDGGPLFPVAHLASTALGALFCASSVVLVYQLCLRWFGRERLDGLMTGAQVVMSISMLLASQLLPRFMIQVGAKLHVSFDSWWVTLLPPVWFGAMDDAFAGSRAPDAWPAALVGVLATSLVTWLAFGKLARDYGAGLQALQESAPTRPMRARRRFIHVLVNAPPLKWWLRDSVSRASFLLAAAYLVRDRDVKLRVYPGLAPMLVLPVVMFFNEGRSGVESFRVALGGSYLAIIPLMAINLLRFSQQWQASDVFRAAPIAGPGRLCDGTRRAALLCLSLPVLGGFGVAAMLMGVQGSQLILLLPGLIALPVFAMFACVDGRAVPFSVPSEEAKSAGRGLGMFGAMLFALVLGGAAAYASSHGALGVFLAIEAVVALGIYLVMRASLATAKWAPID